MPVFEDFSENGKLLSTRDVPLDPTNLPRYLIEHSSERAEGYRDALSDMLHLLGPAIWAGYIPGEEPMYQPSLRRSMLPLVKIFEEQSDFLNHLSNTVSDQSLLNKSKPEQK